MFGRNRANQEEMIEKLRAAAETDARFFAQVEDSGEVFEAGLAVLAESYRHVDIYMNQVRENIGSAAALAEENAKVEAALSRSLLGCGDRIADEEARQDSLVETFRKVADEAGRLVDENKHFTTPSKYLSELPADLRAQNQSYTQSLNQMADYGRQMGVLALNAAIEAGRMGESGMQFVSAAEDIRSYASNYDRAVLELRGQIEQSGKRIEKLEEQIRYLVGLMKDSNMAIAKLMKNCKNAVNQAEKGKPPALSREVTALRDQVMILKNADEEIIKSEERNRIQTEDLDSEFEMQQQNQRELFDLMDAVFQYAKEHRAEDPDIDG